MKALQLKQMQVHLPDDGLLRIKCQPLIFLFQRVEPNCLSLQYIVTVTEDTGRVLYNGTRTSHGKFNVTDASAYTNCTVSVLAVNTVNLKNGAVKKILTDPGKLNTHGCVHNCLQLQ